MKNNYIGSVELIMPVAQTSPGSAAHLAACILTLCLATSLCADTPALIPMGEDFATFEGDQSEVSSASVGDAAPVPGFGGSFDDRLRLTGDWFGAAGSFGQPGHHAGHKPYPVLPRRSHWRSGPNLQVWRKGRLLAEYRWWQSATVGWLPCFNPRGNSIWRGHQCVGRDVHVRQFQHGVPEAWGRRNQHH